jgi:hypothetical protein
MAIRSGKSPGHPRRFTIASEDAVRVLTDKVRHPSGSNRVDQGRLQRALEEAVRQFGASKRRSRQAFFHGLLTGYAVGLKCR